jgi:site-specific recombinase XerD
MAIGRVFKRTWKDKNGVTRESPNYSIAYWFRGRERVESAHTDSETKANKLLAQRLQEIGKGAFALGQSKFFYPDMVRLMKADYVRKGNRSWEDVFHKIKPLEDSFNFTRAADIDIEKINDHVDRRIAEGAAIATINGELRYLRRMLRLACKLRKISMTPVIELLPNENKRDGTVEVGDFNRLLTKFDDIDVRDLVEFLYAAGWRVTSVERLEKSDVDYGRETVKLRDAVSKNKQPMLLSFKQFPTMREILFRRRDKLSPDCKFIFHRNGRRIKDFRAEWAKATAAAKLTGLSVHDLCRSCAVNLSRAGVEETTASKYMNRKTLAIYKQYRIVHTRDTERAGAALETYFAAERNREKIIDLEARQRQNSHRDDAEGSTGERGNVKN